VRCACILDQQARKGKEGKERQSITEPDQEPEPEPEPEPGPRKGKEERKDRLIASGVSAVCKKEHLNCDG